MPKRMCEKLLTVPFLKPRRQEPSPSFPCCQLFKIHAGKSKYHLHLQLLQTPHLSISHSMFFFGIDTNATCYRFHKFGVGYAVEIPGNIRVNHISVPFVNHPVNLYLFQLVFCLIFRQHNWFCLLQSTRGDSLPGKDAVYRFLNYAGFAWRCFLTRLAGNTIEKITGLTAKDHVKVLIVDDSMFERNRSQKVELLARLKDHARNCYYKGFRMLTVGCSDGHSFVPVGFALLSSRNSQLQSMATQIDKRTFGYRRRLEALQSATSLIPLMLDRALKPGISASYVLMDSWFTYAPLLQEIAKRGLSVIGMMKNTNQRYRVNGRQIDLKEPCNNCFRYSKTFPKKQVSL